MGRVSSVCEIVKGVFFFDVEEGDFDGRWKKIYEKVGTVLVGIFEDGVIAEDNVE